MESSQIHNYPADIINRVLEELSKNQYELPAYSQIERLVKKSRHHANQNIFNHVCRLLPNKIKVKFDKLIKNATRTDYNKLKELPKSTTVNHFKALLIQHDWLHSFGMMTQYIKGISQIKLKHFAGEAKSLDASNMRETAQAKRYTLIVCLIDKMQKQAKDNLVIMLIKKMKKTEQKAKEKLTQLREVLKEKANILVVLLNDIVTAIGDKITLKTLKLVKEKLSKSGDMSLICPR